MGWARQAEDRKAHLVTDVREIEGARLNEDHTTRRERIGSKFVALCPHDVLHFFQNDDDYEWMPWLWKPTREEACLLCWRRAARVIGCGEAP